MWSSLAALLPAANHEGLVSYKLPSDAGIQAEILSLASKMHRQVCAREILPLNLFRVATLWPKTPTTSWRSSSCPQRTHHTAGSSASLLPQIWIYHGFLQAACCASCAGETNPRFELPNAQNWWWQISTKRRLTGCMPQRRTHSACFQVSRPRIIIPTLLLSGFLESVISFHVHVHS